MSDLTSFPDDELVSAHLDREARPDESARVLGDPVLTERLEELRAVQASVGATIEVPSDAREAALAAALDLYDTTRATATAPIDLETHRAPRQPLRWLAAAAAVVLVLGGIAAALRVSRPTSTDTQVASAPTTASARGEKSADQVPRPPESGAGSQATNDAAGGGAASTTAGPSPAGGQASTVPAATQPSAASPASAFGYQGYLGAVSSPAALRAAVTATLSQGTSSGEVTTTTARPGIPPAPAAEAALEGALRTCDARVRSQDPEIGPVVFTAGATYQGKDALVFVYPIDLAAHPAANGATRLYAVTRADCTVLDAQTL